MTQRICHQCNKAPAEHYCNYCDPCVQAALPEKHKQHTYLKPSYEKTIYNYGGNNSYADKG